MKLWNDIMVGNSSDYKGIFICVMFSMHIIMWYTPSVAETWNIRLKFGVAIYLGEEWKRIMS